MTGYLKAAEQGNYAAQTNFKDLCQAVSKKDKEEFNASLSNIAESGNK